MLAERTHGIGELKSWKKGCTAGGEICTDEGVGQREASKTTTAVVCWCRTDQGGGAMQMRRCTSKIIRAVNSHPAPTTAHHAAPPPSAEPANGQRRANKPDAANGAGGMRAIEGWPGPVMPVWTRQPALTGIRPCSCSGWRAEEWRLLMGAVGPTYSLLAI